MRRGIQWSSSATGPFAAGPKVVWRRSWGCRTRPRRSARNGRRPPQPVTPCSGVRDGTAYGPTVPKGDYPPQYQPLFPEVVIPGEDCLNLNVWAPDPATPGLPVLVWVHGGSFMNGSGSVAEYDGSAFARDGIVCVTINYRLAAEGFLFTGDAADTNG